MDGPVGRHLLLVVIEALIAEQTYQIKLRQVFGALVDSAAMAQVQSI